jgi:tRNA C32,U32 (ribose-2'-O)-methylase TrmJ
MRGQVNSLNVAQAATILAYEALRQRLAESESPAAAGRAHFLNEPPAVAR